MGYDIPAYINQAGQVYNGQRNYSFLRTAQGPCYYPAGHLWLYYWFYPMYTHTEYAEHYMKIVHFIVDSTTNLLYSKVAYKYFHDRPMDAQMACFMLLAVTKNEYQMFNDQFCALFVALAVYLLVCRNQCALSSLAVGCGLSIKAPVVLLLPSFFGTVLYIHGADVLLTSLGIILAVQWAVAAPFIHGFLGGETELGVYLSYAKYTGGDH